MIDLRGYQPLTTESLISAHFLGDLAELLNQAVVMLSFEQTIQTTLLASPSYSMEGIQKIHKWSQPVQPAVWAQDINSVSAIERHEANKLAGVYLRVKLLTFIRVEEKKRSFKMVVFWRKRPWPPGWECG